MADGNFDIGKAARAMLNFGLTELRLVAPRDGWPNPSAGPAAAGANVVLEHGADVERAAWIDGQVVGQGRAFWGVGHLDLFLNGWNRV